MNHTGFPPVSRGDQAPPFRLTDGTLPTTVPRASLLRHLMPLEPIHDQPGWPALA